MILFIIYGIFFVIGIVAFAQFGGKMSLGEIIFFIGLILFSALILYSMISLARGGGTVL